VFVRPRFLPLSSLSNEGIDTLVVGSDGAGGGGKVVPGGRVFSFGLCELRRLLRLGAPAGGGTSEIFELVGGRGGGTGSRGISADAVAGDVVVDEVFCRLEGGVSLGSRSQSVIVRTYFAVYRHSGKIFLERGCRWTYGILAGTPWLITDSREGKIRHWCAHRWLEMVIRPAKPGLVMLAI
jgi:hypothetical protein